MAPQPQVAIDPLGFGRLAAQNVRNRELDIKETDAAARQKLLDLQVGTAQGAEQSRLVGLARSQKMQAGLQQVLANIPEGENRFTVSHAFLQNNGFLKEAAALREEQGNLIDRLGSDEAQAQLFNASLGRVENIELNPTGAAGELGKPFEALDASGNSVFIVRDANAEGGFRQVEGFTPTGAAGGEDVFKNETTLRKEFVDQSGEFVKSRDAIGRVRAAGKDPSPAGDLALIFNFMKVLDPGSVVRESEFRTAADARAWVQKQAVEGKEIPNFLQGPLNKLTTGQKLIDSQRKDFLNRAERLFNPIKTSHDKRVGQFKGLAKRNNLDVRNIVLDITGEELQTVLDEDKPEVVAAETTTTVATEQPAAPAAAGFKVIGVR